MGIVTLISGAAIQIFDIGLGAARPASLGKPGFPGGRRGPARRAYYLGGALFDFFADARPFMRGGIRVKARRERS
jgi:hypothetical protein